MKKAFAFSLAFFILFTGCMKKNTHSENSILDSAPQEPSRQEAQTEPSNLDPKTPDGATQALLEKIINFDEEQLKELVNQYMSEQEIPDTYYSLLKPISERIKYKIGNSKIDGDKARVDVAITAVDVKSAINNIMPGALAHLATLQIAGKDTSNPEKLLAEYAAKNINWNKLTTIKTDTTLYLIKGADDEWKVDLNAPENIDFANAISGGAIDVAQSLKSFAERFK